MKRYTYGIVKVAHAFRSGSAEVTGNEAADPCLLGGMNQVLLLCDDECVDSADDDVNTIEGLRELVDAVVEVPDEDIEPGCTKLSNVGLLGGGWTNKCSKTL